LEPKAHPRATEAHPGAMEAHTVAMEAHPGAMEAHPGAITNGGTSWSRGIHPGDKDSGHVASICSNVGWGLILKTWRHILEP
jgi:hypothetical protein